MYKSGDIFFIKSNVTESYFMFLLWILRIIFDVTL